VVEQPPTETRVRVTIDLIVRPLPPEKLAEHAREMTPHPETFDSPEDYAAAVEETLSELDTDTIPSNEWFNQQLADCFIGAGSAPFLNQCMFEGTDFFIEVVGAEEVDLPAPVVEDAQLWLWRNGDHYLAYEHEHPCYSDGGDPLTLGEPAGYAILKPSAPRKNTKE
jgi:hypothetical protein